MKEHFHDVSGIVAEKGEGVTDFEVELDGPLEPASGCRITVDLFDDDLGEAHFYITLAGVISKSYIKKICFF